MKSQILKMIVSLAGVAASGWGESLEAIFPEIPTFTKIVEGAIVTDRADSYACAWGDFNNDNLLDLVVANGFSARQQPFVYRNRGGGRFEKVTNGSLATELVGGVGVAWADYNNDGHLDLFMANDVPAGYLYLNEGNGNFAKANPQPAPVPNGGVSPAWADYDNDGLIDLYLPRGGAAGRENYLFRNIGGAFAVITTGEIAGVRDYARVAAWADYDNDGDADLITPNYRMQGNVFYQNGGDGDFAKISRGSVLNEPSDALAQAWADYDNDGDLDLVVVNGDLFGNSGGSMQRNLLYRNNGDGTFLKITDEVVVTDAGNFSGCSWGDYDNDGFIDLYVTAHNQRSRLYRNRGGGHFAKVTDGVIVENIAGSRACSWADFDNNGFLDLFVANVAKANYLYRNNGNSNSWLKVKCVGINSNRSAIGAKIRAKARIQARTVWQMREISGGHGRSAQALVAHLGLGDARVVDMLRIEWPSGIVQELRDLRPNQFLTVIEPPRLRTARAGVRLQMSVKGGQGLVFELHSSEDLIEWSMTESVTNAMGWIEFEDKSVVDKSQRFYRAVLGTR